MIDHRPADTLGATANDLLSARHHFCFAGYQNPDRMSWGQLRVLNHNILAPGASWPPHPLSDVETLQWVRGGAISTMGSLGLVPPIGEGSVQVISTGRGITCSHVNACDQPTDFFDIWFGPEVRNESPRRRIRRRVGTEVTDAWIALASGRRDRPGATPLRMDAAVYRAKLSMGSEIAYELDAGRHAYLVCVAGAVAMDALRLATHDGAAIVDEPRFQVRAVSQAEVLLIDAR